VPTRSRPPKAVKAAVCTELSAGFPEDNVEFSVPYDTSRFVDVAIDKVIMTLVEAMVLVFLVMFLFLQNVRYTLIPVHRRAGVLLGTLDLDVACLASR
jgi:multidrug efflux pump